MVRSIHCRANFIGRLAVLSMPAARGEADFLGHPDSLRDAAVFRPQIPADQLMLKYQKPL